MSHIQCLERGFDRATYGKFSMELCSSVLMLVCPRLLPSVYWTVLIQEGIHGPICTVQGGKGLRILTENPVCRVPY